MKAILRITVLFAAIVITGITVVNAQGTIKGTIYMDGKPAAGITVEVHKGGDMMTGFDGKYELPRDGKSKWIKFTFIDEAKKEDLEGITSEVYDYAFSGKLPAAGSGASEGGSDVNLGTLDELMKAQDKGFMNELSLYTEFYKQKDYNSAQSHWETLYNKYPKSTKNIYTQGAKILEHRIENSKSDAERDALIDQYMKLYDQRMEHFGDRGFVMGRKGTSWLKYKLSANRTKSPEGEELKAIHKSGYEWLNESVSELGKDAEPTSLLLLMQTTVALFKLGEMPKEQVVKNYEKCVKISNEIIEANEDEKRVEQTQETVLPFIENLFGKSGAADCDALVNIFSPQYEQNKDDSDFIKSMLKRLGRARCTESELFGVATERLYELDPSAEAAFNMARRYLSKDNMEKAREYYQMAIDQETDDELLASYYYERAYLRYAKLNDYVASREDARKALSLKPDYCEANMLIGNIYLQAASNFKGTDLEKSAVFWLACDYFNKARRGEDCSIEASELSRKYRKYWPNKEEAFMEGMQEGSTHKVGGWINENTKIRF